MEDTGSAQYQYRKVMKPLLERKRRARINGCLDELKELMECLGGDQSGGQQGRMQRLEKADVLEVTVNHLRNLKAEGRLCGGGSEAGPLRQVDQVENTQTYRSGYSACAAEVAGFICHPYSGVAQPQAARIARVVAEGLTKLQSPASARLASPDTAETPSPRPTPRASPAFSCPDNIKEENSEEDGSMDTGSTSAPLDLSKR